MRKEVVIGLNCYQPPRESRHHLYRDVSTDPDGKDWTKKIVESCYQPLTDLGVMRLTSFNLLGVLRVELESSYPALFKSICERGRSAIGDTGIHALLPDLSESDKRILIGTGIQRFERDFRAIPAIVWLPETAVDIETLVVLSEFGYRAFVCAPEQVELSTGGPADNQPALIDLPNGARMIAIPFDRAVSNHLAFAKKHDASEFAKRWILPRFKDQFDDGEGRIFAWTDVETFGEHWPFGERFLDYLVRKSLPEMGIEPVLINEIEFADLKKARLIERTAWSCHDGDLARWQRGCSCCGSNNGEWKTRFYETFRILNDQVDEVVRIELGKNHIPVITNMFWRALENSGGNGSDSFLSLVSAKVAALVARTSCGTFFDTPNTSGWINILFGLSAIEYLKDAGLVREASKIRSGYWENLKGVYDPVNPGKTGFDMAMEMIS